MPQAVEDYAVKVSADSRDFTAKIDKAIQLSERFKAATMGLGRRLKSSFSEASMSMTASGRALQSAQRRMDELAGKSASIEREMRQMGRALEAVPRGFNSVAEYEQHLKWLAGKGMASGIVGLKDLRAALEGVDDAMKTATRSDYKALQKELNKTTREFEKVDAEAQSAQATLKRPLSGIAWGKIGKTIAGTFGTAAKSTLTDIWSIAKTAPAKLRDIAGQTLTLDKATQRVLKGINGLGSVAKRMLTRMTMKAVFGQVSESMGALAKECDDFNGSMSRMISGWKQFGNQLAAAVGPLVTMVSPYIEQIEARVNSLGQSLAEFSARLSGADHYEVALPVDYDYAEEMDKSASATDKQAKASKAAAKAQKEYNASVLSFDQLHKLNGGSGADSSAEELSQTADATQAAARKFKAIPLDGASRVQAFADKVKRAVKDRDWKGLGNALADGAISGLKQLDDMIRWDNVGDKLKQKIDGIVGTLNTLIGRKDLFKQAGTTIGDGVNTIAKALQHFDVGMHWQDLGNSIAQFFHRAIGVVDWQAVGHDLMAGFMIPWDILSGFIREADPTTLGSALHDLFEGALNRFDPAEIGGTIGMTITKLAAALETAASDPAQWCELGSKMGNGILSFFENLDGAQVADALNSLINGITTAFSEMWHTPDLRAKVTEDIKGFFEGLDWAGLGSILGPIVAIKMVPSLLKAGFMALMPKIGGGLLKALGGGSVASGTAAASGSGTAATAASEGLSIGAKMRSVESLVAANPVMISSLGPTVERFINWMDDKITGSEYGGLSGTGSWTEKLINWMDGRGFSTTRELWEQQGGVSVWDRQTDAAAATADRTVTATIDNTQAQADEIAAAVRISLQPWLEQIGTQDTQIYLDGEQLLNGLDRANRRRNVRRNPQLAVQ